MKGNECKQLEKQALADPDLWHKWSDHTRSCPECRSRQDVYLSLKKVADTANCHLGSERSEALLRMASSRPKRHLSIYLKAAAALLVVGISTALIMNVPKPIEPVDSPAPSPLKVEVAEWNNSIASSQIRRRMRITKKLINERDTEKTISAENYSRRLKKRNPLLWKNDWSDSVL